MIRYIKENYTAIETDMNIRNNTSRKAAKSHHTSSATIDGCEIKLVNSDTDADHEAANEKETQNIDYDNQDAETVDSAKKTKHRKKREELSVSATKGIKKEVVNIILSFN